jgi:Tol biopolymer transport system component/DNA-binding winged helix-turn-helix (wHTH) protein
MSEHPSNLTRTTEAIHYRFGTFDLDVRSGELRRDGVKLRLQEQPFQVLLKLLEGQGGLVTREALQAALWASDTFVDFDTSLNTAIKRLRESLGDSADIPVFIETVPRRGYRFLAPIQEIANGQTPQGATTRGVALPGEKKKWRTGIAIGLCSLLGLSLAVLAWRRIPAPLARVTDSAQLTWDGVGKGNMRLASGFVYFNELLGNQIALTKVPVGGGTATVLNEGDPGLILRDVSKDGTKFLVTLTQSDSKVASALKVMDASTSSLSDLHLEVANCSWAPGGKLLYSTEEGLFLANADGTNSRKLLTTGGYAYHMRYSPDGKRLRYTSIDKITFARTLWEAKADGSGQHEIFAEYTDFPQKCCGEWSADGRYYFYQGGRDGSTRIFALKEDSSMFSRAGKEPVQLTTLPLNFYMGVPSEDGKKLFVTASQPRAQLERFESRTNQFVPYLGGISAGGVEESHDRQWVVYVKYPEQTLWRARADGSSAQQLTGPLLRAELPHWSPDDKRIAFSGARVGHPWNIYIVSPDGGPAEQVTGGDVSDLDASWSPDGKTIVFGQIRTEAKQPIVSIQVLDVATQKVTKMTGTDGICCPRWSPDGKFLVASHPDNSGLELYEFAAQKWRSLLKDDRNIGYMEWTSDSKNVLFDTYETKEPGFFRLRVSDQHLEKIVGGDNINRYYGEFGPWAGSTADGAPLLVRDVGIEEMYSLDLQLP